MSLPIQIDSKGTTIQLISRLGSGAYGTVFKALRTKPAAASPNDTADNESSRSVSPAPNSGAMSGDDFVAVKEMPFDSVADEPSDIVKEIEVLSGVDSLFCVQFYGAFFHDGVPSAASGSGISARSQETGTSTAVCFSTSPSVCIVQQLVEGGSVLDFLETLRSSTFNHNQAESLQQLRGASRSNNNPGSPMPAAPSSPASAPPPPIMSDEQIGSVVVDVLHALVYLHDQSRIVHRDIKCANILLSVADGRCRLCDFGTGAKKETAADQRRTTIGTPGWMAPEVWSGSMPHSFPADIWTLGATVLEMCLRTSPSANPLFSQYITVISQMSCSFVPQSANSAAAPTYSRIAPTASGSGMGKTFSDLEPLMNVPLLFDLVACCLRRDPTQRPAARHLLLHPFIIENGVSTGSPRKVALIKRMANQLLSALSATAQENLHGNNAKRDTNYALGGTIDPKQAPKQPRVLDGSGRLLGQRKPDSITVQHLFDHGLDNTDASDTQHSGPFCPPLLAAMWTSEPFRALSSSAVPSATPKLGRKQSTVTQPPQQCGVFAEVLSPATADARVTMQRVFSIYRSLGTPPSANSTEHSQQQGSEPYTISELQSSNVSFEHHEKLMDKLLQSLHSVENLHHDINELRSRQQRPMHRDPAAPVAPEESFSLRSCQWLTSFLLTNFEDSDNLQHMFEYFEELQQNPFRHHYRLKGRREAATAGSAAGPNVGGRPSALVGMRKVSGITSSAGATAAAADHSATGGLRMLTGTEQILSTPPVPVYNPVTSPAAGLQRGAVMTDPSASLFNKWLAEQKQRTWAQL